MATAAVEDVRCALHWVFDHASEFGFDTSKIVVTGHSAGGHLALMAGMLTVEDGFDRACSRLPMEWRSTTINPAKVAAVLNFIGPTNVADLIEGPNTRGYAIRWFAGMDNRMEVAKRVSPLTYIHKGNPPILSILGSNDTIVPYAQGVAFHKELDRAGTPNRLVTIEGGGHGGTPPFEWTREQNQKARRRRFRSSRSTEFFCEASNSKVHGSEARHAFGSFRAEGFFS